MHTRRFDDIVAIPYNSQFVAIPDSPINLTLEVTLRPTALNGVAHLDFKVRTEIAGLPR